MWSTLVESQLRSRFFGDDLQAARSLLPVAPSDRAVAQHETLLLAVIELSEGSLSRLQYFANRAQDYPFDVIQFASFPPTIVGNRVNHLEGGPLQKLKTGPYPVGTPSLDLDLWIRSRLAPGMVCIVCRKIVSKDIWANPVVRLSRTADQGLRQTITVTAHDRCMSQGRSIAEDQGYGWELATESSG